MKTSRKIATVAAAAAVLGLGSAVHAQEADSARAAAGDRPMPMMEGGDMHEEMGMRGMMRMMRMIRGCMDMMDSMGMEMGDMSMGMSMKDSMREGPEAALRRAGELGLSEEQVERLEEARSAWREAREAAMERMHEAHEAMGEAAVGARDRTREVLTPEQRDRLSELKGAGMEGCPMHGGGSGAEPGAESEQAPPGGRDA